MKAARIEKLGPFEEVLQIVDRPAPEPGPGQALVAVRAAALNFPDILMAEGKYQFKPDLPFIPGMEGSGVVLATGPGLEGYRPGDRVLVRGKGGIFAEQVCVGQDHLDPLPDALDFAEGAAFSVAFVTAWHCLMVRGRLQAGEWLLVHGASGGVGMAAVGLAKHLGAHVIATGASDAKLEAVRAYGADHVINISGQGFRQQVKEITGGRGADIIIDPVGGDVFTESLRAIAWNGRLLVVGFTSGDYGELPTNYPLLKGCSVIGVRAGEYGRHDVEGGRAQRRALRELAAGGQLRPHISHRFAFSRIVEAYAAMAERRVVGKAVIEFD